MSQPDPCARTDAQVLSFRFQGSPVGGESSKRMAGHASHEYVTLWIRHLRRREFSTTTTRSYRDTLTTFGWWLADQHTTLANATPELIEAWLDSRDLAPSTRRHYLSRIHAFYQWMLDQNHIQADPTRKLNPPKVRRYLPRPAPSEQVYQNISAPDARTAAMIALGAYTGMRRFEIAKLRGEDIDLTQNPPVVRVRGKGDVDRRIPLNQTVLRALERYGLPPAGWVFPSNRGGPISAQRCGRLIAEAMSTSNGRVTAHQLRHWFGCQLYQGSGDIRMVQDLLGHASLATTMIYTAWDSGRAGPAVAALPTPPEAA